jgi:hypothetical protein
MNARIRILVIALGVVSLAVAPSLIINQAADASSHHKWCENQGKSVNWVNGCKQGWWDHDHCNPYDPDGESNAFYTGYKVGWKKGHCK